MNVLDMYIQITSTLRSAKNKSGMNIFFFYRFYCLDPHFNFYLTNSSQCLKTTIHGLEIHLLFSHHINQEYVNMYGQLRE